MLQWLISIYYQGEFKFSFNALSLIIGTLHYYHRYYITIIIINMNTVILIIILITTIIMRNKSKFDTHNVIWETIKSSNYLAYKGGFWKGYTRLFLFVFFCLFFVFVFLFFVVFCCFFAVIDYISLYNWQVS